MRSPVYKVSEHLVLRHVLAAMIATGRRHLAVMDSRGRCHGVVGDRPIAAAWAEDPSSMAHQRVRHVLDARPAVIGTDADDRRRRPPHAHRRRRWGRCHRPNSVSGRHDDRKRPDRTHGLGGPDQCRLRGDNPDSTTDEPAPITDAAV
jgi:hypothetical protein